MSKIIATLIVLGIIGAAFGDRDHAPSHHDSSSYTATTDTSTSDSTDDSDTDDSTDDSGSVTELSATDTCATWNQADVTAQVDWAAQVIVTLNAYDQSYAYAGSFADDITTVCLNDNASTLDIATVAAGIATLATADFPPA